MKLHTIHTGFFKLDGGAMFGVVPKVLWERKVPCDENNLCTWAMRCLLLESEDRLILIDTGIGDKQKADFFKHYHLHGSTSLQSCLESRGFSLEQVTDVFLTHLHFDHVGGAVTYKDSKLQTTFPNATYWSNKDHWQWATHPNDREKASFLSENIMPIQESGQLQLIDPIAENPLSEFFDIRYVYGHTEAMMLPLIPYHGGHILYCADLLPSVAHIPLAWIMGYDMRPLDTLSEKKLLLEEAAREGWTLYFEHDSEHMACKLTNTEKGIRAGEILNFDW